MKKSREAVAKLSEKNRDEKMRGEGVLDTHCPKMDRARENAE